jgi:magnesium-transporting ATPase (P-type)
VSLIRLTDQRTFVICSDKTGTLTRNEMTVRHLVTRVGQYNVEGIGYAPEGRVSRDGQEASLATRPDLQALVEVMAVCNDSEIAQEDGQWVEEFSPIQVAPQSDGPPDRRQ